MRLKLFRVFILSLPVLLAACAGDDKKPKQEEKPKMTAPADSVILEDYIQDEAFRIIQIPVQGEHPVLDDINNILSFKTVTGYTIEEVQKQWNECLCGLAGIDHVVNYNMNGILDVTYQLEHHSPFVHFEFAFYTIDIKSGKLLTVADLMDMDKADELAEICERKLNDLVADAKKEFLASKEVSRQDKNDFIELFEPYKFKKSDLKDFSISTQGVHFMYYYMFPPDFEAFEPSNVITLTFEEITPFVRADGLLKFLLEKGA